VAANFNRTFDPGIVVRLSGGYSRASAPDQGGQGSSLGSPSGVGLAAGTGTPDPYWWYVGGYVGYRGFSLGGCYGRNVFRNFSTGSNNGTPAFFNAIVSDAYAWSVAAAYNYGPFGVTLTFEDARNSDCSTTAVSFGSCGSRDRLTIVVLNGSYQLGPGVFWEAGVFHAKINGNSGTPATSSASLGALQRHGPASPGPAGNRATGVDCLAIWF
jgi:predicted porin